MTEAATWTAEALASLDTDALIAELERRGCVLCVYGPDDDDAPDGYDWAAVGGFATWARENGASVEQQTYDFMVETLQAEADATGVPREEEADDCPRCGSEMARRISGALCCVEDGCGFECEAAELED